MKVPVKTYQLVIISLFITIAMGCAQDYKEEPKTAEQSHNEHNEKKVRVEEVTTAKEAIENSSPLKKEINKSRETHHQNIWKRKAKQQLETVQDLLIILQDSTLENDFKIEIENELKILYPGFDSPYYIENNKPINFKQFKYNTINDTLLVEFKNKKETLVAKFTTQYSTKQFGKTTEKVEQLKLIEIKQFNSK